VSVLHFVGHDDGQVGYLPTIPNTDLETEDVARLGREHGRSTNQMRHYLLSTGMWSAEAPPPAAESPEPKSVAAADHQPAESAPAAAPTSSDAPPDSGEPAPRIRAR
jgi:hypothetical protein